MQLSLWQPLFPKTTQAFGLERKPPSIRAKVTLGPPPFAL
jgi:hypothetical protein